MEHLTLPVIRASSRRWRSPINFDGAGGCRLIDANHIEVPLLSVIAFSGIMTATLEAQCAQPKR